MSGDLGRPIRVVYFGGPYLQPGALRFAALLGAHPEVELVLGLCESQGLGFRYRWHNLWQRRGPFAIVVLMLDLLAEVREFLRAPRDALRIRRLAAQVLPKFETAPDLHAPELLKRLQALAPDLGVIYGAPVLKPELFGIPALGTLGIHHGRVPAYRGKKTTFWEIYNGERVAGITVQKVNPGIDTGEIVRSAEVDIGRKGYGRVWREVELAGCDLYVQAVLDFKRGCARIVPQDPAVPRGRLYRQPAPRDLLRLWWSRLTRQRPPGAAP